MPCQQHGAQDFLRPEQVVDISAAVPKKLDISDTELASVMGNLTSNSLEACRALEDGVIEGKEHVPAIKAYLAQYGAAEANR